MVENKLKLMPMKITEGSSARMYPSKPKPTTDTKAPRAPTRRAPTRSPRQRPVPRRGDRHRAAPRRPRWPTRAGVPGRSRGTARSPARWRGRAPRRGSTGSKGAPRCARRPPRVSWRDAPREDLVEDEAEGVHVAAHRDLASRQLLRRHVRGRPGADIGALEVCLKEWRYVWSCSVLALPLCHRLDLRVQSNCYYDAERGVPVHGNKGSPKLAIFCCSGAYLHGGFSFPSLCSVWHHLFRRCEPQPKYGNNRACPVRLASGSLL